MCIALSCFPDNLLHTINEDNQFRPPEPRRQAWTIMDMAEADSVYGAGEGVRRRNTGLLKSINFSKIPWTLKHCGRFLPSIKTLAWAKPRATIFFHLWLIVISMKVSEDCLWFFYFSIYCGRTQGFLPVSGFQSSQLSTRSVVKYSGGIHKTYSKENKNITTANNDNGESKTKLCVITSTTNNNIENKKINPW